MPDWLPVDHVYWDLPTFGIDDAADAIRQRLRRVGGVRKVETAGEMAVRQKRERAAANDRDRFRQTEGREAARTELRTIFQALSEIAAASGGVLTEPTWNNVQTVITFAPIEGARS